jgi:hypothetical protein
MLKKYEETEDCFATGLSYTELNHLKPQLRGRTKQLQSRSGNFTFSDYLGHSRYETGGVQRSLAIRIRESTPDPCACLLRGLSRPLKQNNRVILLDSLPTYCCVIYVLKNMQNF